MHLIQEKSRKLYSSSARYDVDNETDQRDYKQQVNWTTANVTNETQQPKHQQNHENRPQHRLSSFVFNLEIPKNPGTTSMGAMSMPIGEKADGCKKGRRNPHFLLESKRQDLQTQAGRL